MAVQAVTNEGSCGTSAPTLPAGPSHTVYVVAVDATGTESALDGPLTFTVPFIAFP